MDLYPPLRKINVLHVRLSKGNQNFLAFVIHGQNLRPARIDDGPHRANVFAVGCKDAAALQLKRVKPSASEGRQFSGRNGGFATDVLLSLRYGVDAPKFDHDAPMLATKIFNFCVARCFRVSAREPDAPPGFEQIVLFEQHLDADRAFQALGFDKPGDGYKGGF